MVDILGKDLYKERRFFILITENSIHSEECRQSARVRTLACNSM